MEREKNSEHFIVPRIRYGSVSAFFRLACPCNVDPITPHFYLVKLGFTGVYSFYAPNFEKVGSILVSACACVRSFVLPSVQKKIQARALKFHIWILRQKIAYPYFFSCPNYLPLPSYAPLKG